VTPQPPAPPAAPQTNEIELLKSELAALKKQQEASQSALESLTASSLASANRAAAIEAHLALQSSLIDDLRTATQQQQQQQWKALDAVSEGIDRMLQRSGAEPAPKPVHGVPSSTPPPASPSRPSEIRFEEILSQEQDESSGRTLQ